MSKCTNCNKAKVTIKGNQISLCGNLPEVGIDAPKATLTDTNLAEVSIDSYKGKTVILNIFPSLDTPTCAASVREFNKLASSLPNTVVLCISMDLPFAAKRFCTVEGLSNVFPLSGFRSNFGKVYGVSIEDMPMKDLYARSVVVINPEGKVAYTQLVPEITNEPNYEEVIKHIK